MIFASKKAKIIDKASSKWSHEAWIRFTPCGLRTTSLVNDKKKNKFGNSELIFLLRLPRVSMSNSRT